MKKNLTVIAIVVISAILLYVYYKKKNSIPSVIVDVETPQMPVFEDKEDGNYLGVYNGDGTYTKATYVRIDGTGGQRTDTIKHPVKVVYFVYKNRAYKDINHTVLY